MKCEHHSGLIDTADVFFLRKKQRSADSGRALQWLPALCWGVVDHSFWLLLPPVADVERTYPQGVLPKITLAFALCLVFWDPQPATNIKQPCESRTPSHSCGTGVLTPSSHSFSSPMVECWGKCLTIPSAPHRPMSTAQCLVFMEISGVLPS